MFNTQYESKLKALELKLSNIETEKKEQSKQQRKSLKGKQTTFLHPALVLIVVLFAQLSQRQEPLSVLLREAAPNNMVQKLEFIHSLFYNNGTKTECQPGCIPTLAFLFKGDFMSSSKSQIYKDGSKHIWFCYFLSIIMSHQQ